MKRKIRILTAAQSSAKITLIRVSIVDEDAPGRKVLAEWIQSAEGFQFVSAFGSAEEGLAKLPRQRPDVVLMDINLPGLSGVECLRRLKPQLPRTRFVMHTANANFHHILSALQSGANGYLLKPSVHDELLAALRYVHTGGSPMTSHIARQLAQCLPGTPLRPPLNRHPALSPREREVLDLLARGFFYKEIAHALRLSVRTVETHIRRLYEKLHVRSRAQAVASYASFPPGPASRL